MLHKFQSFRHRAGRARRYRQQDPPADAVPALFEPAEQPRQGRNRCSIEPNQEFQARSGAASSGCQLSMPAPGTGVHLRPAWNDAVSMPPLTWQGFRRGLFPTNISRLRRGRCAPQVLVAAAGAPAPRHGSLGGRRIAHWPEKCPALRVLGSWHNARLWLFGASQEEDGGKRARPHPGPLPRGRGRHGCRILARRGYRIGEAFMGREQVQNATRDSP